MRTKIPGEKEILHNLENERQMVKRRLAWWNWEGRCYAAVRNQDATDLHSGSPRQPMGTGAELEPGGSYQSLGEKQAGF